MYRVDRASICIAAEVLTPQDCSPADYTIRVSSDVPVGSLTGMPSSSTRARAAGPFTAVDLRWIMEAPLQAAKCLSTRRACDRVCHFERFKSTFRNTNLYHACIEY